MRGTPQEMAKRRFITFLSEIDPVLIDVMPDEKPPPGFPLNKAGLVICAKCNTLVGCSRPLLDENKIELRKQLFESEELQNDPDKLRKWIVHALSNQRCVWGAHQAIAEFQAKQFINWFSKDENRGFFAYDSSTVMFILKELVQFHHDDAYEIMLRKSSWSLPDVDAYNAKGTLQMFCNHIHRRYDMHVQTNILINRNMQLSTYINSNILTFIHFTYVQNYIRTSILTTYPLIYIQ